MKISNNVFGLLYGGSGNKLSRPPKIVDAECESNKSCSPVPNLKTRFNLISGSWYSIYLNIIELFRILYK